MRAHLEPIGEGLQAASGERTVVGSFAIINRAEMVAMTRAMPDSQSAILFCLAWHAAISIRMRRGPRAGRHVARVSVGTLAKLSGRPVRTVQYALHKLRAAGVIERENTWPGRTSVYKLRLLVGAATSRPTEGCDRRQEVIE